MIASLHLSKDSTFVYQKLTLDRCKKLSMKEEEICYYFNFISIKKKFGFNQKKILASIKKKFWLQSKKNFGFNQKKFWLQSKKNFGFNQKKFGFNQKKNYSIKKI